jgi:uncharacterized protein YndB with AHSA1/START domain
MSEAAPETAPQTRTVTVEREIGAPPEKLWRALTQPHLIAEWLMKNDFVASVGHRFALSAEWGAVACEVLEIEPHRSLSYTWDANGLESIVTWTLTPIGAGTRLRMEQTGFKPDQQQAYHGARAGWPKFFARLDEVMARID